MTDIQLLVTGATGHVGGMVARQLAAAGVPQRLLVRDVARAPQLAGAELAQGSYGEADALRVAFKDIQTVFMVSGAESPNRVADHLTFIDTAVASGVRRLVYLSIYGSAPDAIFTLARDHWVTEQHILKSGVAFTFLRDNLYLDFLPLLAGEDGVIRGPAGDGRVAAVAQADVADVASAVLQQPDAHDGRTYNLTGREALSLHDAAAIISQATGRTITYQPETIEEAYTSRAHYGAPNWQVDAWVSTYTAIAAGAMESISGDVERLAGHPPLTLSELLSRSV